MPIVVVIAVIAIIVVIALVVALRYSKRQRGSALRETLVSQPPESGHNRVGGAQVSGDDVEGDEEGGGGPRPLPQTQGPPSLAPTVAPRIASQDGKLAYDGRFPVQDTEAWLAHLRTEGFVVIANALSAAEAATAKDLLWQDLESTAADGSGLSRHDPDTWNDDRNFGTSGLIPRVTQHAGPWYVRGCPNIKQAFAQIWETEELITSMDVVIVWRPWWRNSGWKPVTEGLHLDQNPFKKPGLHCVQGMVPLLPVTRATGGLQVVPGSHTDEAKTAQKKEYPYLERRGDWCPLHRDESDAVLLLAEPGDLILWDSRTIHGGVVGTGEVADSQSAELARLSVTVAMTPRKWASEQVQKVRLRGFRKGENFNHSPHEAGSSSGTLLARPRIGFKPIELTEAQRALL